MKFIFIKRGTHAYWEFQKVQTFNFYMAVVIYCNLLSNIKRNISCHKLQLMKFPQLQLKIGQRIKFLRESKGITQQDLAAMCNFEKGSLSRIEAGERNLTLLSMFKISQALDITIEVLVKVE